MLMPFHHDPDVQQGMRKVLARAMTDPSFRELCLQDPAAAYLEATGAAAPQGLAFRFKEGEGTEWALGLPDPAPRESPLTEQELEAVAGGSDPDISTVTCKPWWATKLLCSLCQA
jgi:hypothetical protein